MGSEKSATPEGRNSTEAHEDNEEGGGHLGKESNLKTQTPGLFFVYFVIFCKRS